MTSDRENSHNVQNLRSEGDTKWRCDNRQNGRRDCARIPKCWKESPTKQKPARRRDGDCAGIYSKENSVEETQRGHVKREKKEAEREMKKMKLQERGEEKKQCETRQTA